MRRRLCQHLNDRRRQAAAVDQRCTDHRFLRRRARISSWSRSHVQYSHRCFCHSQRDRRPAHSCSEGLTSLERSLRTIYLTVSSRVPNAHGRSERHATGELAHLGAVSISKPCRSNVPWCRPRRELWCSSCPHAKRLGMPSGREQYWPNALICWAAVAVRRKAASAAATSGSVLRSLLALASWLFRTKPVRACMRRLNRRTASETFQRVYKRLGTKQRSC